MLRWTPLIAILVVAGLAAGLVLMQTGAESADDVRAVGVTFTMTLESPGQEAVTFAGVALGEDSSLTGRVGGIETVMRLTDGSLYILTPAIKTAREIENPDPPGTDEDGWSEWLLEPGRINSLTFASVLGEDEDVDGRVRFGAGNRTEAGFDEGRLILLRFPSPSAEGTIVYTYSDFEDDPDVTPDDFQVPADYRISD